MKLFAPLTVLSLVLSLTGCLARAADPPDGDPPVTDPGVLEIRIENGLAEPIDLVRLSFERYGAPVTSIGWEKVAPGTQSSYQIYNDRAFDATPKIVAEVDGVTMDALGQIDYTERELAPGRYTFLVYALPTPFAPEYEAELGVTLIEE